MMASGEPALVCSVCTGAHVKATAAGARAETCRLPNPTKNSNYLQKDARFCDHSLQNFGLFQCASAPAGLCRQPCSRCRGGRSGTSCSGAAARPASAWTSSPSGHACLSQSPADGMESSSFAVGRPLDNLRRFNCCCGASSRSTHSHTTTTEKARLSARTLPWPACLGGLYALYLQVVAYTADLTVVTWSSRCVPRLQLGFQ